MSTERKTTHLKQGAYLASNRRDAERAIKIWKALKIELALQGKQKNHTAAKADGDSKKKYS